MNQEYLGNFIWNYVLEDDQKLFWAWWKILIQADFECQVSS